MSFCIVSGMRVTDFTKVHANRGKNLKVRERITEELETVDCRCGSVCNVEARKLRWRSAKKKHE